MWRSQHTLWRSQCALGCHRFLFGLLRGLPLPQCARLGCLAGAAAVRAIGAELGLSEVQWLQEQMLSAHLMSGSSGLHEGTGALVLHETMDGKIRTHPMRSPGPAGTTMINSTGKTSPRPNGTTMNDSAGMHLTSGGCTSTGVHLTRTLGPDNTADEIHQELTRAYALIDRVGVGVVYFGSARLGSTSPFW